MATPTYTLLDSVTLGSSAASVTFSSISQDYRDLVLVIEAKSTYGSCLFDLRFNGDSGDNYYYVQAFGTGSTTESYSGNIDRIICSSASGTTTSAGFNVTSIMDYSATDKHKTTLSRGNNAASRTEMMAGRWANTSAITSMNISAVNEYAAGSTFYLYGIEA